ncbi:hypothetical protein Unana1_08284 [Umbelopsis nana]
MNPVQKLQQDAFANKDEKTKEWHSKLVGKTLITDKEAGLSDQVFRIKDLPQPNRVLKSDSVMTMDYRPERLNVIVDNSNKVTNVHFS